MKNLLKKLVLIGLLTLPLFSEFNNTLELSNEGTKRDGNDLPYEN
ncbi:hypothetical protein ACFW35_04950 [Fictibacillus sp. NPDC058756]